MRTTRLPAALAALLLAAAPALADGPAFWAQWRGPTGQGVATDAKVPLAWGESENLAWKLPLPGPGNSTPVVWGDRVFLTCSSADGDERVVLCVSAKKGEVIWKHTVSKGVPAEKTHGWNGFASASCAVDKDVVVAFFGTPGLHCFDHDGNPLWKHSFGVFTNTEGWGAGASPFLYGDTVIQNCDNSGTDAVPAGLKESDVAPSALVALDKKTGKPRWSTPRTQGLGYSTPVLIPTPDGDTDLVLNGPHGVWAYDPKTGTERWHAERHKGERDAMFGEPMPVFTKDALVAISGRPGPVQQIRLGGSGDVTKKNVVWDVPRAKGSRDVSSPVLAGDLVYLADRTGQITALEWKSGATVFKERSGPAAPGAPKNGGQEFVSSLLNLNGKVLATRADGVTFVIEPGRAFKVERKNVLIDGTEFRASPAVADGRLFLRSQSHLYCIAKKD